MWILFGAVVTASLMGSMHCVGMCGPLALWASGAAEKKRGRSVAFAAGLYHLGRLTTYATVGLVAGTLGQLVDIGGAALGIQLAAARVVGVLMIGAGLLRLWPLLAGGDGLLNIGFASRATSVVGRWLAGLRPHVLRLPLPLRGFATGLLTVLLPCGWLYLFALVAAGTGTALSGMVVMVAFWIGTVPALVAVVTGLQAMSLRFRRLVPVATASLLIAGGIFTISGRGFAKLNSLSDIAVDSQLNLTPVERQAAKRGELEQARWDGIVNSGEVQAEAGSDADLAEQLEQLVDTPLPCCQSHGREGQKE